jgi:hypothetical protein
VKIDYFQLSFFIVIFHKHSQLFLLIGKVGSKNNRLKKAINNSKNGIEKTNKFSNKNKFIKYFSNIILLNYFRELKSLQIDN